MELFETILLCLSGYAFICYIFVLILDSAADSKLDTIPVFLASFFFTPIIGAITAVINIVNKTNKK